MKTILQKIFKRRRKKILGVFSHAFVINMDECHERMQSITRRLSALGIEFERFPGIRIGHDKRQKLLGCNTTHLEIVKEAKRRNLESVLILEDDAIFRPDFLKLWSRLVPQLQKLEYDIFYGYEWHGKSTSSANITIVPVEHTYCAHFWAIHSRFYDSFIETVTLNNQREDFLAIDLIFTGKNARLYAPSYNLVGQDGGFSVLLEEMKDLRWSAFETVPL